MTDHLPTDEVAPAVVRAVDVASSSQDGRAGPPADWNPRGPRVRRDAVAAYDEMRSRCPVARGPDGTWTLFSHADVVRTAMDPVSFSNAVSRHLQIPNGLDGTTHTAYRAVVDRYFTPERMADLEPAIHDVARRLVEGLDVPGPIDAVHLGARFAVQAQSTWLGWPAELEPHLLRWVHDNQAATRSREPSRTAEVAERFTAIVRSLTDARREAGEDGPADVTAELVRDRVDGRPLTDEEIVSILRNWTGGDLGSMALCAGVVLTYLADHHDLQARVRSGVSDHELDAVLDEILRIDDPFVANRRVTTRAVTLGGRQVLAGEQVVLNWTAANRDPQTFGDPDEFDPVTHASDNLVWGTGAHVCPGRPLATMELRALTRAVLDATTAIGPDLCRPRERALPPSGGFTVAPLLLR
ncbi:cytochrome P450 [Actinotalea sp. K2]|uniref:cytochrome P450 n=1 Tax=Actinotalea sp. K2 TaxID=2939438 RepID=UPI00201735C2|nr:cytochrome P450 [Actinotalea sp. K2]MCL3861108.1 cytochrome P450 [Actinotalea sp. K2]